ncbi:hypothetical protein [Sphingobacterium yanglingense]|uniref:DUF3649 domain-containing protein n=1 Tax=Sphingobacterium yanglingense TaxID=1437280 RepID=A0A4R6WJ57_9SPHI|nr:hypothetical protein [Sphingobacterium yanglingense]TDQ80194.1 hypothetical protein CLV99_1651 [Sphingobacterium yanglingense]
MPANKKYLSTPFQRFLKMSAGFVGGYSVMLSFHLLLSTVFEKNNLIITAAFTGYTLWAVLLLLAFLAKNGWKVWLYYAVLTLVFALPYLLKN